MGIELATELNYLYDLERFGIKLGLSVMEQLLVQLGHPEQQFKSIHITGTNGKGSTAAMLESILRAANFKTALYTSPHLYRFNERVQVAGQPISDQELLTLIKEVREASERGKLTPTFFEFTTALAFVYFARQKVDIAVIEVGMGGTLDATNVISPLVAIITNVGLDHRPLLGRTKAEITANKAGIIKPGSIVVTAETDPHLQKIIAAQSTKQHAQLLYVADHIQLTEHAATLQGQNFTVQSPNGTTATYFLPLLGMHQITNALTTLVAISALQQQGIVIPAAAVSAGLQQTVWEGRLDVVSSKPFILVDGAHNLEGVATLRTYLTTTKLPRRKVLLLALKQGKDYEGVISELAPLFTEVVVTQGNYEPAPAAEVAELVKKIHPNVIAIPQVAKALAHAQALVGADEMLLITGSLYMIGDALALLRHTSSQS